MEPLVQAIARAAADDSSGPPGSGNRRHVRPSADGVVGLILDGLSSLIVILLGVALVAPIAAAASVLGLLLPRASRPPCPRCGARTTRVGETAEPLGGGMTHVERLHYCPGCRTILQNDSVSHVDPQHAV